MLYISPRHFYILPLLVHSTYSSVAVGIAQLNPDDLSECIDPETNQTHTINVPWNLAGYCGQAMCESVRDGVVYISYQFCGSVDTEYPCYLTSDPSLFYPGCCPTPECPPDTDKFEYMDNLAENGIKAGYESYHNKEDFKNNKEDSAPDNSDDDIDYIVRYDTNDYPKDGDFDLFNWEDLFGDSNSLP